MRRYWHKAWDGYKSKNEELFKPMPICIYWGGKSVWMSETRKYSIAPWTLFRYTAFPQDLGVTILSVILRRIILGKNCTTLPLEVGAKPSHVDHWGSVLNCYQFELARLIVLNTSQQVGINGHSALKWRDLVRVNRMPNNVIWTNLRSTSNDSFRYSTSDHIR
jgi:hypothetical protein